MTTIAKTTAAVLALALALPMAAHAQTSAMTAPAAKAKKTMSYDCTKAGNKNKAACKSAAAAKPATPAVSTPAPATPVAAAPAPKKPMFGGMMGAKPSTPKATAKTEANNPNVVAYTTKTGKVIHYDCSKAGNKNKAACKGH